MKRALVALAATALALGAGKTVEPYRWGHELTPACQWRSLRLSGAIGGEHLDAAAEAAERACWVRRGDKGLDLPIVQPLLAKWPTGAELAAWSLDNAQNGHALPASE